MLRNHNAELPAGSAGFQPVSFAILSERRRVPDKKHRTADILSSLMPDPY